MWFTQQDCQGPFMILHLLQVSLSIHSPEGNNSPANFVFPLLCPCPVMNGKAGGEVHSHWTLCLIQAHSAISSGTSANVATVCVKSSSCCFFGCCFGFFFQYLSPPFPTEGCCLSKRGNVQIAKEMMCFEHSRSGVVKQGAIVLFG